MISLLSYLWYFCLNVVSKEPLFPKSIQFKIPKLQQYGDLMGVESQNCRMALVAKGSKAHSVPTHSHRQGCHPPDQAAQTPATAPLGKKKTLKHGQKHSNMPCAYAWKRNQRQHALPHIQRKKHSFHLLTSKIQRIKKHLRRKSFGKSKAGMDGEFGWQKRSNLMCLLNLCCQERRKYVLVQTQNACRSTKIPSIL